MSPQMPLAYPSAFRRVPLAVHLQYSDRPQVPHSPQTSAVVPHSFAAGSGPSVTAMPPAGGPSGERGCGALRRKGRGVTGVGVRIVRWRGPPQRKPLRPHVSKPRDPRTRPPGVPLHPKKSLPLCTAFRRMVTAPPPPPSRRPGVAVLSHTHLCPQPLSLGAAHV